MSAETMEWLNTMTLKGFTDQRTNAWHYLASLQGDEPNHYPGPIPVGDVERRLMDWEPIVASPLAVVLPDGTTVTDPDRQAIIRPDGALGNADLATVLGVFKSGYKVHSYREWLLRNVEILLDDGLAIASAGLLRGGAQAWVQIQAPDTLTVEGFGYRAFVTAFTSMDGSLATGYITGADAVECDNTLSAAIIGADTKVKIKHTLNSLKRAGEVRDALGLVHQVSEDFEAQVRALMAQEVTEQVWDTVVDLAFPLKDEAGKPKQGRALTMASNARDKVNLLWVKDARVAPWSGTAFGAVQAFNTYAHHVATVKGGSRAQRNAERVVRGGHDDLDRESYGLVQRALALVA